MSTDDTAAEHPTDETHDETHETAGDEPLEPAGGDLVETARRRHGTAGAIVAAGMLGIEQVLGRKPKEEAPIVVAAPTDPLDVDRDGISVAIGDEVALVAPPLPRTAPVQRQSKRNKGSARRR
jgi:hypothetical protein